jgi:prepilin-type processing-associated H-X9-DG protein
MPFLEQGAISPKVDLSTAWDFQPVISGIKIPTFACPSDPQSDKARNPGSGRPILYPTNYGFNYGTWFIYDPATKRAGDGLFYPNAKLSFRDAVDGTASTLLLSEVKAWTPYNRNGGPSVTTMPQNATEAAARVAEGTDPKDTGHTEWPDGRVHHTGFTVALPPNTIVNCTISGTNYQECDYNSWQEGRNGSAGNPTYALITSRSFHQGMVNAAMLDGSVKTLNENLDIKVWHALGTRNGSEHITDF